MGRRQAILIDAGPDDDYVSIDGHTIVAGGAGDDAIQNHGDGAVVTFNAGDGNDYVYGAGQFALSLGNGIQATDLFLTQDLPQDGGQFVLSVGASDSIRLGAGWGQDPLTWPPIALQMIGNGTVKTYDFSAAIGVYLGQAAQHPGLTLALAPVLQQHVVSTSTTEALGGAIAYQYAVAGNADALTAAQEQAVLSDVNFGVAPQPISLTVANRPPVVANPMADQVANANVQFSLQPPLNVFVDPDAGDTLTFNASRGDGTALPAWLHFDAATRTFSGTPTGADAGVIDVKLTATDRGNLGVSDEFRLTVRNPGIVVTGNASGNTLAGTAGEDTLDGGAGNDLIDAGAGNDLIIGGSGSDTLSGGDGDDVFQITGSDTGYDQVNGGAGADLIQGGSGDDTFRFYNFSGVNTVESMDGGAGLNVVAGTAYGDTLNFSGTVLTNIANIDSGVGNDVITGSAGGDVIIGGTGSDTLSGGDGDDVFLITGMDAGYDQVNGGAGADLIQGSSGDDTFRFYNFSGANTVERVDGGAGLNVVAGTAYGDTLDFSGTALANIANIDGGVGNDVITGGAGGDVIIGGAGSDTLSGGDGDDDDLPHHRYGRRL